MSRPFPCLPVVLLFLPLLLVSDIAREEVLAFPSYQFRIPNGHAVPCPPECINADAGLDSVSVCALVGHLQCSLHPKKGDGTGERKTPSETVPTLQKPLGRVGENIDLNALSNFTGAYPETRGGFEKVRYVPPAPRSLGLNVFGLALLEKGGLRWNTAVCEADSDGDGWSNGEELGDPCCSWDEERTPSGVQFGDGAYSHPGWASSVPSAEKQAEILLVRANRALKCPSPVYTKEIDRSATSTTHYLEFKIPPDLLSQGALSFPWTTQYMNYMMEFPSGNPGQEVSDALYSINDTTGSDDLSKVKTIEGILDTELRLGRVTVGNRTESWGDLVLGDGDVETLDFSLSTPTGWQPVIYAPEGRELLAYGGVNTGGGTIFGIENLMQIRHGRFLHHMDVFCSRLRLPHFDFELKRNKTDGKRWFQVRKELLRSSNGIGEESPGSGNASVSGSIPAGEYLRRVQEAAARASQDPTVQAQIQADGSSIISPDRERVKVERFMGNSSESAYVRPMQGLLISIKDPETNQFTYPNHFQYDYESLILSYTPGGQGVTRDSRGEAGVEISPQCRSLYVNFHYVVDGEDDAFVKERLGVDVQNSAQGGSTAAINSGGDGFLYRIETSTMNATAEGGDSAQSGGDIGGMPPLHPHLYFSPLLLKDDPNLRLPAGKSRYFLYRKCTVKLSAGVSYARVLFHSYHMHNHGGEMLSLFKRKKKGAPEGENALEDLFSQRYFSWHDQGLMRVHPRNVTLHDGDELLTACVWDLSRRTAGNESKLGYKMGEEMCMHIYQLEFPGQPNAAKNRPLIDCADEWDGASPPVGARTNFYLGEIFAREGSGAGKPLPSPGLMAAIEEAVSVGGAESVLEGQPGLSVRSDHVNRTEHFAVALHYHYRSNDSEGGDCVPITGENTRRCALALIQDYGRGAGVTIDWDGSGADLKGSAVRVGTAALSLVWILVFSVPILTWPT